MCLFIDQQSCHWCYWTGHRRRRRSGYPLFTKLNPHILMFEVLLGPFLWHTFYLNGSNRILKTTRAWLRVPLWILVKVTASLDQWYDIMPPETFASTVSVHNAQPQRWLEVVLACEQLQHGDRLCHQKQCRVRVSNLIFCFHQTLTLPLSLVKSLTGTRLGKAFG